MSSHEHFMQHCIDLAKLGISYVAPNPMVGAVLVYDNKIIGEGYHQQFGKAHAEVNCINSVQEKNKHYIPQSTLYVSLEPCNHFGKTPPCTNLIIENKIPRVIIGSTDTSEKVNGSGIKKLLDAGIVVTTGILEDKCRELNKRFFTFNQQKRPYLILKWAQTADKKIAANSNERLLISNEFTNRLVHCWRSEEQAILIGSNTAEVDDPSLSNRLWNGNNPIRLVVDKNLRLPQHLQIFNQQQPTIIFNYVKNEPARLSFGERLGVRPDNIYFYLIDQNKNLIDEILHACFELNVQSILIEGGAQLLQSFIDKNIWDEARVVTNKNMVINKGLAAPVLHNAKMQNEKTIFADTIQYFVHE